VRVLVWTCGGSLLVGAGTPGAIIDRWIASVRGAFARPEIVKQLAAIGMDAVPCSPDVLMAIFKEQMDITGKLAKAAGIEPQ
jgi:tripartite-type tricarboxylate transporter receptor subunit TctC